MQQIVSLTEKRYEYLLSSIEDLNISYQENKGFRIKNQDELFEFFEKNPDEFIE